MEFEDALRMEKKLVISDSRITVMNTRWAVISERLITELSSPKYGREIYYAGKEGCCEAAARIKKEQGMSPQQLVNFYVNSLPEFGWGAITLESFDPEKKHATLQTEAKGNTLLCGMIAGIFKAALEDDVDAEETEGEVEVKKNELR